MMKAGIRSSKIKTFEEESDWLEPIAMTMIITFPLLFVLMIIGAIIKDIDKISVPIINTSLGTLLTAIAFFIMMCCYMKFSSMQRKKYNEKLLKAEQEDREEYLSFVELARGNK